MHGVSWAGTKARAATRRIGRDAVPGTQHGEEGTMHSHVACNLPCALQEGSKEHPGNVPSLRHGDYPLTCQ